MAKYLSYYNRHPELFKKKKYKYLKGFESQKEVIIENLKNAVPITKIIKDISLIENSINEKINEMKNEKMGCSISQYKEIINQIIDKINNTKKKGILIDDILSLEKNRELFINQWKVDENKDELIKIILSLENNRSYLIAKLREERKYIDDVLLSIKNFGRNTCTKLFQVMKNHTMDETK